jgi:hypothetical protein
LKFFSNFWNLYIIEPCDISAFAHEVWESSRKSGWFRKKFPNQNGLYLGVAIVSIHSFIGQWLEPDFGRIISLIEGPSSIRVSEMRDWSSLQAICWAPDHLLYQVKVSFLYSISIRLRWSKRSKNLPLSCLRHLEPPLFYSSVWKMLKYPPKIQHLFPISLPR